MNNYPIIAWIVSLNEKREVVGIVYAGADMNDDYDSNMVGFISLV